MGIFDYPGDQPFGCKYCAGTGFLSYPSQDKPCPIQGHADRARQNFSDVGRALHELHKNDIPPKGAVCPYCKADGAVCRHWTGMGWSRDK